MSKLSFIYPYWSGRPSPRSMCSFLHSFLSSQYWQFVTSVFFDFLTLQWLFLPTISLSMSLHRAVLFHLFALLYFFFFFQKKESTKLTPPSVPFYLNMVYLYRKKTIYCILLRVEFHQCHLCFYPRIPQKGIILVQMKYS